MIDLRHRIDGTVAWANLPPDVQSTIGAAAIELVAAWVGLDAACDDDPAATSASRAFEAADSLCSDRLHIAVEEHVRRIDPDQPPLPSSLGRVCHRCGCSEQRSLRSPGSRVAGTRPLQHLRASDTVNRGLTPLDAARQKLRGRPGAGEGRGLRPAPAALMRPLVC